MQAYFSPRLNKTRFFRWNVICQVLKKIIMENNASKIKNLTHQEAIDKFKELVKHESTCLFTTRLTQVPLTTRPMSVQKVCDQGTSGF